MFRSGAVVWQTGSSSEAGGSSKQGLRGSSTRFRAGGAPHNDLRRSKQHGRTSRSAIVRLRRVFRLEMDATTKECWIVLLQLEGSFPSCAPIARSELAKPMRPARLASPLASETGRSIRSTDEEENEASTARSGQRSVVCLPSTSLCGCGFVPSARMDGGVLAEAKRLAPPPRRSLSPRHHFRSRLTLLDSTSTLTEYLHSPLTTRLSLRRSSGRILDLASVQVDQIYAGTVFSVTTTFAS